jgi:LL-diaminopimelate aminotransferase
VKTNLDSGQFTAVQRAAIAALEGPEEHLDELRATYQRRRDLVIGTLNGLGWSLKPPLGSCYVWVPTPDGESSVSFADRLLDATGVFVAPGSGYGDRGEGFVRFSLTVPDDRLAEALDRVGRALS